MEKASVWRGKKYDDNQRIQRADQTISEIQG